MFRFLMMMIFFGSVFIVGFHIDRFITKRILSNWIVYSMFSIIVLISGFGIILVQHDLLKYIMTFLLAISLLILYLRLNRVFKHKLAIMERRENVKR